MEYHTRRGPVRTRAVFPHDAGDLVALAVFCSAYAIGGFRIADEGAYSLPSIAANLSLLQVSIDGVMRSLPTEVLAIPLLFCAWRVQRQFGSAAVAPMAVLLATLSSWKPWATLLAVPGGPSRVVFLYAFLFGTLAWYWGPAVTARIGGQLTQLSAWVAVFIFFAATPPVLHGASIWTRIATAGVGAVLLSAIAFGRSEHAAFSRLLRAPVCRFYGRISYSFYLLHPLTLTVAWHSADTLGRLIEAGFPAAAIAISVSIASVAVTTPLAWLCHRYVEVPGVKFGRRVRDMRASPVRPRAAPDGSVAGT